jgi:beta-1,4-N-acetylglucosaminyltransferase
MINAKKLKICITCSSGGHYRESQIATQMLRDNKYFVSFWTPHLHEEAKQNRFYFIKHPQKNIFKTIINAFESLKILLKEKPNVIISTGADVAVATCILGKFLGAKLIFIESGGQVYSPSLSGRIVYPFADLFIVQWRPALKNYPKAIYGGPLF